MPSFEKPTQQQIDVAVQRMRSPDFATYFLSRLENPQWISALRENNIFDNPAPAVILEGGGVQYPHWPPSRYLAKMAQLAPSEVSTIFGDLQTNNMSIIGDMIDAALVMPPEVAVPLVQPLSQAVRVGDQWIYCDKVGDLCVHLAEGGQLSAALTLAQAIFAPEFEDGQEEPRRHDIHWYKEALAKVVPVLAPRNPREFLPMLCDWLKVAVCAKQHVEPDSGEDYSYIWCPAIEEHEQNRDYEFAGVMVGFVREAFECAVRGGQLSLDEALKVTEQYHYLVFRRLELHLINEFAEQSPELAQRKMMDSALFNNHEYKHEYATLMGHRFDLLTPEERGEWFGWVDSGPGEAVPDEGTDEERQARLRYWQFEKLHWVRNRLEGERQALYEAMITEHGEPEMADLNIRVGAPRWGRESPMTLAELSALPFEEAVEKVSVWKPDQEQQFMGPDTSSLASTFGEYVATNPKRFSREALLLIGRPASYVREFIKHMSEAVKAGVEIDLEKVLDLCKWIIEQPVEERTTPKQVDDGPLVDKSWQWTREEMSRFLENVCQSKIDDSPRYPMQIYRESIWQLLEVLCRDRAKSNIVHDTSQDDPRLRDFLDLGINSARGKAIEAALEYARWVANHIKQVDNGGEIVPGGFESIPEVRDMLEWQIAPGNRSFEAMSIIGSRIGLIYYIDKNWLAVCADRLFFLEGIENSPPVVDGWAAWNAFLVWVTPHIEFYKLLKKQFAFAVKQTLNIQSAEDGHERPLNHLGQHLMLLYGRGQLGLDDDGALLQRFLDDANPSIRRHALGFIGQSLQSEEKIPSEVVERFKVLWERYWDGQGRTDAEEKPDAWLFGPWFSCGKFPEKWALEQLERYVAIAPMPEPSHQVVEQLAQVARTDIARTTRILDKIVRGDREGWHILHWLDSARDVLESAIESDNDEARKIAADLISYLGRRGYAEFGELLR